MKKKGEEFICCNFTPKIDEDMEYIEQVPELPDIQGITQLQLKQLIDVAVFNAVQSIENKIVQESTKAAAKFIANQINKVNKEVEKLSLRIDTIENKYAEVIQKLEQAERQIKDDNERGDSFIYELNERKKKKKTSFCMA